DLEARQLNVRKLRSEVRDGTLRWWQRPSWIGAIATIIAALAGLTWAITTNYFENRLRELRLETRDLEARRDGQTRRFEAEKRLYESRLEALRKDVARLN